jgi:hypothetical protein
MPPENNGDGKGKHYAEELRHRIDKGEGADKDPAPDPAGGWGRRFEPCGQHRLLRRKVNPVSASVH